MWGGIGSKLSGLKKPRTITRDLARQGYFGFSYLPFKVYSNERQFRLGHLRGMPRALLRTDPKKRWHSVHEWHAMARCDAKNPDSRTISNARKIEKRIQAQIKRNFSKTRKEERDEQMKIGRLREIVHPARKREDIKFSCLLKSEKGQATQSFFYPRPENTVHRMLTAKVIFSIAPDGIGLYPTKTIITKEHTGILEKAIVFCYRAKREAKHGFEASFVTYKDTPTELEFFDFRQFKPETQKRVKK